MNRVTSASSSTQYTIPLNHAYIDAPVPRNIMEQFLNFVRSTHCTYRNLFKDAIEINDEKERTKAFDLVMRALSLEGGIVETNASESIPLDPQGFTNEQKEDIRALINKAQDFTIAPEMIAFVQQPLYDVEITEEDAASLEQDITDICANLKSEDSALFEGLLRRYIQLYPLKPSLIYDLTSKEEEKRLGKYHCTTHLLLYLVKLIKQSKISADVLSNIPQDLIDQMAREYNVGAGQNLSFNDLCERLDPIIFALSAGLETSFREILFESTATPFLTRCHYLISTIKSSIICDWVTESGFPTLESPRHTYTDLIKISHLLKEKGIIGVDLKTKLGLDDTIAKAKFDLKHPTLGLSEDDILRIKILLTDPRLTQLCSLFPMRFNFDRNLKNLGETKADYSEPWLPLLMELICERLHYQMPEDPTNHYNYLRQFCFKFKAPTFFNLSATRTFTPNTLKFILKAYFEPSMVEDLFGDIKNAASNS